VFGDEPARMGKEALPPPDNYALAAVGQLIRYKFSLDRRFFIGVL